MRECDQVPFLLNEIEELTTEVEGLLSDGCFQAALEMNEARDHCMRELFLKYGDEVVEQFFPNYLKCIADNKYLRDQLANQNQKIN